MRLINKIILSQFGNKAIDKILGTNYYISVRVIARTALRNFSNKHKDAKEPLDAWWHEAKRANWISPADIKAQYKIASIIKNDRVVFNICGNKYRLVVRINYKAKIVYIRFVGTHKEYNKIDVEVI